MRNESEHATIEYEVTDLPDGAAPDTLRVIAIDPAAVDLARASRPDWAEAAPEVELSDADLVEDEEVGS